MLVNPQYTYVSLSPDGVAAPVLGGAEFWCLAPTDIAQFGVNWLISEYCFDADWPTWEMHPQADEFVYLLSGQAQLHLEHESGVEIIGLSGSGAVLVPRGRWHTAKITIPSRILHITLGVGTQTRPV